MTDESLKEPGQSLQFWGKFLRQVLAVAMEGSSVTSTCAWLQHHSQNGCPLAPLNPCLGPQANLHALSPTLLFTPIPPPLHTLCRLLPLAPPGLHTHTHTLSLSLSLSLSLMHAFISFNLLAEINFSIPLIIFSCSLLNSLQFVCFGLVMRCP